MKDLFGEEVNEDGLPYVPRMEPEIPKSKAKTKPAPPPKEDEPEYDLFGDKLPSACRKRWGEEWVKDMEDLIEARCHAIYLEQLSIRLLRIRQLKQESFHKYGTYDNPDFKSLDLIHSQVYKMRYPSDSAADSG